MPNLIQRSNTFQSTETIVTKIYDKLKETQLETVSPAVGRSVLAMEGISDDASRQLDTAMDGLKTALESLQIDLGLKDEDQFTPAQSKAAQIAGIGASNFRDFLAHKPRAMVAAEGSTIIEPQAFADTVGERRFAAEAYDERENRNAVVFSLIYNLQSARQDEFGETLYPTITTTPEHAGIAIVSTLLLVYDAIEREISGAVADFKKKNILRALADPTVLRKEQTRLVPVARTQSTNAGVFSTAVAQYNISLEGETIPTRPLRPGVEVDLIGLSIPDSLLATGTQNQTDTLDPTISLQTVYAQFGNNVLRVPVLNLPTANFMAAPQGNYRLSNLNFNTSSVLVVKGRLNVDNSNLDGDLAQIDTEDLIVRLKLNLTGSANIETGNVVVYGNKVSVTQIQRDGQVIPLDDGSVTTLVAALNSGTIVGYDLLAYRTNANRRQQGQLIDVTRVTQQYLVPLRSPITAHHPAHADGSVEAADVQALITATRIRTSNEAVTALLQATEILREYVDVRDLTGEGPEVLGIGRHYVRPQFAYYSFNAENEVDGVRSHHRAEDLKGALVNRIRDMAYNLYRDSEYKAAADALHGGVGPVPVVILATDPVLARYLNVTGDLRTLGQDFDVRVVSTLDQRVAGKIFVTFGCFDDQRNVSPNPLNFGNLIWAPELVLTANISRTGTFSKETLVQPRYLFINNLPVAGLIEVSNIPNVLNKLPLFVNDVTEPVGP